MDRHQRCRAALAGLPVDRAPRYVPGIACEVASRLLGRPALAGTGSLHFAEAVALWQGPQAHREFRDSLFEDLAAVMRILDIDVYRIPWRMTTPPRARLDEHTFLFGDPEGEHTVMRYSPDSGDFGQIGGRRAAGDPEEWLRLEVGRLEAGGAPEASLDPDHIEAFRRFGGEFFLVCNGGGISTGIGDEDLLLIASAPELVARKLAVQAERAVALGRALAASDCPRVLIGGGDLAGNDGPFYSPCSFRALVLPALRRMLEGLRASDAHLVFRSDGDLWPVADMLFREAGCPGYGEVDRQCGMTTGALRERYPGLVVWGNFPSDGLLKWPASRVREESARMHEESGGSRYFHGASNAILQGTPLENLAALFG